MQYLQEKISTPEDTMAIKMKRLTAGQLAERLNAADQESSQNTQVQLQPAEQKSLLQFVSKSTVIALSALAMQLLMSFHAHAGIGAVSGDEANAAFGTASGTTNAASANP